ncbi:helix-turn-helix domain-containing protein [Leifsonia shinshuensis]
MQPGDTSVLAHLGENLRRLRRDRSLSQEALAQASGISRRTIINLEAGETNVSLVALDRLAGALGATFTDLVVAHDASEEHLHPAELDVAVWRGADTTSIGRLVGAVAARSEAQVLSWQLAPGERYDADPDPAGWHEIAVVLSGAVRLRLDAGGDLLLRHGDHAAFSSAQRYTYEPEGEEGARFLRIVVS